MQYQVFQGVPWCCKMGPKNMRPHLWDMIKSWFLNVVSNFLAPPRNMNCSPTGCKSKWWSLVSTNRGFFFNCSKGDPENLTTTIVPNFYLCFTAEVSDFLEPGTPIGTSFYNSSSSTLLKRRIKKITCCYQFENSQFLDTPRARTPETFFFLESSPLGRLSALGWRIKKN